MITVTRISKHPLRYHIEPVFGDWVYVGLTFTKNGWKPKLRWSQRVMRQGLRQCGDCRFMYQYHTKHGFRHECAVGMPVAIKPGCLFATYCSEFDEK